MLKIAVYDDLKEARRLWQRHYPKTCLFDFWPVRAIFHAQFNYRPYFIVAEQVGMFRGMLALSWIEEAKCFGHFPGEIWQGKTWMEQNKIIASNPEVLSVLLDHIPAAAEIRYLNREFLPHDQSTAVVDEIGYLFFPKQYGYSFQAYMQRFSGKSRKKIRCELNRLEAHGVSYRYDCFEDLEHLFRLNLESFKENSFFSDLRFLRSFVNLAAWLQANKLLRVTTVLIGGKIVAVDMGTIWGSTYTVLAGGTHADFPGVAKLINLHHIEWACHRRLAIVDFLCGDFNWKQRFHLTPRSLYKISIMQAQKNWQDIVSRKRTACAY